MKKFKYEIYLPITQDEAKALKKPLDELGYNTVSINDGGGNLVTNHAGEGSNSVGQVGTQARIRYKCRSAAEFLALAAMVDSDDIYKGESVVWLGNKTRWLTPGKVYQTYRDSSGGWTYVVADEGIKSGWPSRSFRKATKEEIIEYYSPKKTTNEPGKRVVAIDIETGGLTPWVKFDLSSKPSKYEGWYTDTMLSDMISNIKSPVGLNWIAQQIAPDWSADNVVYTSFDQSQFCTGQEAVVHISPKKSSTRKLLVF